MRFNTGHTQSRWYFMSAEKKENYMQEETDLAKLLVESLKISGGLQTPILTVQLLNLLFMEDLSPLTFRMESIRLFSQICDNGYRNHISLTANGRSPGMRANEF